MLSEQISFGYGREARDVVSYARKISLRAAKPFQRSVKILDRFSSPSSFQSHSTTHSLFMFRARIIAVLFIPLMLVNACKSGPDASTVAARDAVDALRKIQAATQVGMTYDQYSGLVIEAKAKTEKSARALPDGPLKIEISNAIDSYTDGVAVWQMQLKGRPLELRDEPGARLLPRYSIQPMTGHQEALKIILQAADVHVERAAQLLEGGS
jgi:hypothetical protein